MKVFRYTLIDIKRGKEKIIAMLLLGLLGYCYADMMSFIMGITYVMFTAVIFQGTNFTLVTKAETGFINLLPGSDRERVAGRFLTGILYTAVSIVLGMLMSLLLYYRDKLDFEYVLEVIIAFAGVALMFGAVQNTLFFAVGISNNKQLASLVHITPGLLFFGVTTGLSVFLEVSSLQEDPVALYRMILKLQDYSVAIAVVSMVMGILFSMAGIYLSEKIVSGKDYS